MMKAVDWSKLSGAKQDADEQDTGNASQETQPDVEQLLTELRKACDVPIDVFLNWLGWFDYRCANGGGGIEQANFGVLLDMFIAQTKDPEVRKQFEGDSWYWIYATPNHPGTCGGVVL